MNPLSDPTLGVPLDHQLSPLTGWTREHWHTLARRMLDVARSYGSRQHALLHFPGAAGGYGTAIAGLEGYSRVANLVGFLVAGDGGEDPDGNLEWFAEGLAAGVDPTGPERWVRPGEHGQAVVECATLVNFLDLTSPWLWPALSERTREQVVDYLSEAREAAIPDNNWVWFVLASEAFLRQVGAPWSPERVHELLAQHESFYVSDGWYRDGPTRNFDHYNDFALNYLPLLWSRMPGAQGLDEGLAPRWRERLARYLGDLVHLIGSDGGPMVQGRSLIYRFGVAGALWMDALSGVGSLDPGLLRRATSGIVQHFQRRGCFEPDGVLTLGWHGQWRAMAQPYSSTGSPYWATLGMAGLALGPQHPVWTSVEKPLPVDTADFTHAVLAPGWIASGTHADGVVRILNHGTDHGNPGELTTEAPLYSRLGYSTVTSPAMAGRWLTTPGENTVCVLDQDGAPSFRSGIETLRPDSGAPHVLGSRWRAHWIGDIVHGNGHGGPESGTVRLGPWLSVVSVVRHGCEVRIAVADGTPGPGRSLRLTGWPVAADGSGARASFVPLSGLELDEDLEAEQVTPLSERTRCACAHGPLGVPVAFALAVHGEHVVAPAPPLAVHVDGRSVRIVWPDGEDTVRLPLPGQPPVLSTGSGTDGSGQQ